MNPDLCSLRALTTGVKEVGSRAASCRACISVENLSMATSNEPQEPHRAPAKKVNLWQSSRL